MLTAAQARKFADEYNEYPRLVNLLKELRTEAKSGVGRLYLDYSLYDKEVAKLEELGYIINNNVIYW